jgi:putative nucleotidyltransferase with HDIG domain
LDTAPASWEPNIPELERRLEQLPLLPAVVSELLSLDPDANEYFDELLHLAERDPGFAARVLRCANSAYSAPLEPIVSLREAFIRLGTHQCARLVLAVAVTKVFSAATPAHKLLSIHSLQTAMFTRMFSEEVRELRRSREQAYVCGLLHDMGRFVLFDVAPTHLEPTHERAWTGDSEMVELERETLGYDHALLGAYVCQKWQLPPAVTEVVRYHHERRLAPDCAVEGLVRIVQWADELSIVLTRHPDQAQRPRAELGAWIGAEFPALGPAGEPKGAHTWRDRVAGVYAEADQLCRQLGLL